MYLIVFPISYPALSDSDIQKRSEMKNVLCHGSVITKYGHKGLDLRAAGFVPALLGKGFCLLLSATPKSEALSW